MICVPAEILQRVFQTFLMESQQTKYLQVPFGVMFHHLPMQTQTSLKSLQTLASINLVSKLWSRGVQVFLRGFGVQVSTNKRALAVVRTLQTHPANRKFDCQPLGLIIRPTITNQPHIFNQILSYCQGLEALTIMNPQTALNVLKLLHLPALASESDWIWFTGEQMLNKGFSQTWNTWQLSKHLTIGWQQHHMLHYQVGFNTDILGIIEWFDRDIHSTGLQTLYFEWNNIETCQTVLTRAAQTLLAVNLDLTGVVSLESITTQWPLLTGLFIPFLPVKVHILNCHNSTHMKV